MFEHPVLWQTLVPLLIQALIERAVVIVLGPAVVDALEVVEVRLLNGQNAADN